MEGEFGVPTAPIVTSRFAEYVIRDGKSHGMNLRWTFPPYPVAWVPRETLQVYINGNDPVTGKKLMTEVIDALTAPLTEAEKNPEVPKREKIPRLLEPDSEANFQRIFLEKGWTDLEAFAVSVRLCPSHLERIHCLGTLSNRNRVERPGRHG